MITNSSILINALLIQIPTYGVTSYEKWVCYKLFFSVIDGNFFEMTEKNYVISVRMSENIG